MLMLAGILAIVALLSLPDLDRVGKKQWTNEDDK